MDDIRARIGAALLALAFVVGVASLAVPRLLFDDARLAAHDLTVMKSEARLWSSIPPVRLQVTEAAAVTRAGAVPDGAVTWRTLLGVPYGETTFRDQQSATRWEAANLLLALAGVAITELSLIASGAWLLWSYA